MGQAFGKGNDDIGTDLNFLFLFIALPYDLVKSEHLDIVGSSFPESLLVFIVLHFRRQQPL